jgi:lipid-A-disaccharide synthase
LPFSHYTVMFSAGESSGDRHAANLFLELKKLIPDVQGIGMGGASMRAAGIKLYYDSTAIAVIGVLEVAKHYFEIRRALTLMQQHLSKERPDLLICVDYKEFNYKLAKFAKQIGIKVLFYVSPQVWAWRPNRVIKYGRIIDMMAVIFPFETPYYEAKNIPVRYVGHPSVDKVSTSLTKPEALQRFKLNANMPVIGLLPGSRVNEVARLLPVMLEACSQISARLPSVQYILPQAGSISDSLVQRYLSSSMLNVKVIKSNIYDAIQCCNAVMTASGTVTLELALLTIPMAICYKLSWLTYGLGRLLVKTPYIGLPNIIAGEKIVQEFIQHEATPANLAAEIIRLLSDSLYQDRVRQQLQSVKAKLGAGGSSLLMAQLAVDMLKDTKNS